MAAQGVAAYLGRVGRGNGIKYMSQLVICDFADGRGAFRRLVVEDVICP